MRDDAASNPLSFVVAGSLIIGIIGVALVTTGQIGDSASVSSSLAANREVQAEGLLDLLVGVPSDGRLSLRHPSDPTLDLATFRELQLTKYSAVATPLSYQTVATGLGLGAAGLDFHIRSYPTLQAVQSQLGNQKDPFLEVAYIGHVLTEFNGGDAPTIESLTCAPSPFDGGDTLRYTMKVRNTGLTPTQFRAVLEIKNGPGGGVDVQDQSGIVLDQGNAPNNEGTITFDVPNTADNRCLSSTSFEVDLYGTNRKLASDVFSAPTSGSGPSTVLSDGLVLTLREHYYNEAETVVLEYVAKQGDVLNWKLYQASDITTAVQSGTHTVPNKNHADFGVITFPAPAVPAATEYIAVVAHDNSATASQRVLVLPAAQEVQSFVPASAPGSVEPDQAMIVEAEMVDSLMERFNPSPFNADSAPGYISGYPHDDGTPGDVYWDEKKPLTISLADRLDVHDTTDCVPVNNDPDQPYPDILVVGSNVDHQAMTSGPFKLPLADWVECGGLLIVFGSPDGSTQWMQPIFHVGDQQGTGGLAAPDTTHPLLRVPHSLDYDAYENYEQTWKYTGNAEQHFTNIVNQGNDPVTALSDAGDFGRGSVLISQWLPYDVFGTDDGSAAAFAEGRHLMDNFVTQAYRDLFLDYGPRLPPDAQVIPAFHQSQVVLSDEPQVWDADTATWEKNPYYHPMCREDPPTPADKRCHVDMTLILYVF